MADGWRARTLHRVAAHGAQRTDERRRRINFSTYQSGLRHSGTERPLGQDDVLAQLVQAYQRFNLPTTWRRWKSISTAEPPGSLPRIPAPGESIHYLPVTLTLVLRAAFEKVEYQLITPTVYTTMLTTRNEVIMQIDLTGKKAGRRQPWVGSRHRAVAARAGADVVITYENRSIKPVRSPMK